MKRLFQHDHYKDVIQERIDATKEKGYKGRLAEAAACKNSYISQVLTGPVHLTPEHAHGLTQFWGFNTRETDYFLLLLHHDRAGTSALRKFFRDKILGMRRDANDLAKTVFEASQAMADAGLLSAYYGQWYGPAIHMLIGIPGYQTPAAIAKRLQLEEKVVIRTLHLLQDMGLARAVEGQWQVLTYDIHLAKDSPLAGIGHMNWRHRAMQAQQREDEMSLHFTAINSVAKADMPALKQSILTAIANYRQLALPSREEELVCFTADFFVV